MFLDKRTRVDAASDFFGLENVPKCAITMGINTILSAKKIVIMAFSENKAPIVKRSIEGKISKIIKSNYN